MDDHARARIRERASGGTPDAARGVGDRCGFVGIVIAVVSVIEGVLKESYLAGPEIGRASRSTLQGRPGTSGRQFTGHVTLLLQTPPNDESPERLDSMSRVTSRSTVPPRTA